MDTARIAAADLTTLQIAVPAADPLLGHLRDRLGDDATVLSPGHVSFGYPWLPPPEAAVAVDAVAAALREVQPPWVTLVGPRWFPPDHRGRTTAHLVPEPVDAVLHLAGVVADTSDHHPVDLRPHCSLVRVPAGRDPATVEAVAEPWLPIATTLAHVELRVRHGGRWRVARRIAIGPHG